MNTNISFENLSAGVLPGAIVALWVFGTAILWFIVNVCFAMAVWTDSVNLARHLRRNTFFVGGGMWALTTLLGGVFVAAVYWVIHHSTLRPQSFSAESTGKPSPGPAGPAQAEP